MKTSQDKINKFIDEYKQGDSITVIGKRHSVSAQTVWKYVKKAGVNRPMSVTATKHSLNADYFDDIDTEYKAYFLGLLYGDGSNDYGTKNNRITITMLKEDALELLEPFRKELNLSRQLIPAKGRKSDGTAGSDLLTLTVYNKHMSQALARWGVVKNKHASLSFPTISPSLYRHFVRGFFDADGYVGSSRGFQCGIHSNSKQLLLDIKDVVNLECKFYTRQQSNESYQLAFTSMKEAEQFHNWMYKNASIYLPRKARRISNV